MIVPDLRPKSPFYLNAIFSGDICVSSPICSPSVNETVFYVTVVSVDTVRLVESILCADVALPNSFFV